MLTRKEKSLVGPSIHCSNNQQMKFIGKFCFHPPHIRGLARGSLVIRRKAGQLTTDMSSSSRSSSSMMSYMVVVVLHLLGLALRGSVVVADNVHASIKNRIGEGKSITVHCQSKDNDLGEQTVADGSEFGWDFSPNAWGTTLFYCDMASVPPLLNHSSYPFDAYSFPRDFVRCQTQCSWLVSNQGIYALNSQTGFWEFMYLWPNSNT